MPRPQGDFRQKQKRQLPRAQTNEYLNSKVLSVSEMKLQFSNAESSLHWHTWQLCPRLPSVLQGTESTHHEVPEASSHSTIPTLSAPACAHLYPGDTVKRPPQERRQAHTGPAHFFFPSFYASSYTTLCCCTWEPVFSSAVLMRVEQDVNGDGYTVRAWSGSPVTGTAMLVSSLQPLKGYIFPIAFTTWSYTSTKNK